MIKEPVGTLPCKKWPECSSFLRSREHRKAFQCRPQNPSPSPLALPDVPYRRHTWFQMAIARFLDRMRLTLQASGLWLCYATLQNFIPSFPWIAPLPRVAWSSDRPTTILPLEINYIALIHDNIRCQKSIWETYGLTSKFYTKNLSSWVNFRVKLGCQSIGVSYTFLGSPNIMEYCCILDFLR